MAAPNLQWNEIREFGGLWTRSDSILAPTNSATIMSGCHPQPGGGLRPFFKVSETIASTGIDSAAIGRGFLPIPVTNATVAGSTVETVDFALITAEPNGTDWHIYVLRRMAAETSWTLIGSADGAAFDDLDSQWGPFSRQPSFVQHGTPTRRFFFTMCGLTTKDGAYELFPYGVFSGPDNDPQVGILTDWTAGSEGLMGPVTTHQSRLVIANNDALVYSEALALNARPSSDFIRYISPNTSGASGLTHSSGTYSPFTMGPAAAWVAPIPPSDFLVCTFDGRLYNIQGDFDDPTIRDLGQWGAAGLQQPAIMPSGVVCIYPNDGVYQVTPDGGRRFLSQALEPELFNHTAMEQASGERMGFGALAHSNGFVFCPNTSTDSVSKYGALVYDTTTEAWFTSTHGDDEANFTNPRYFAADFGYTAPGVWGMRSGVPASHDLLYRIVAGDTDSTARAHRNNTWEWQSQPLRNDDGRQIELREVQLALNCGADANVTVTITNDAGSTATATITPPSGKSVQRLQFRLRGEFMQVKVKAWEDTADREAPTLDYIRIGTRPGHLL